LPCYSILTSRGTISPRSRASAPAGDEIDAGAEAIRKGVEQAKKNVIRVPLTGTTIPHMVDTHFGASKVLLKPAAPGTGVIAGGAVRAVVEAAGIRDILSKSYGSNNPVNVVKAAIKGLEELRAPDSIAAGRGLTADQLIGRRGAQVPGEASKQGRGERPPTGATGWRGGTQSQLTCRDPIALDQQQWQLGERWRKIVEHAACARPGSLRQRQLRPCASAALAAAGLGGRLPGWRL